MNEERQITKRLSSEPLQYVAVKKWVELQDAFRTDWPRGISGYTILETQRIWLQNGFEHDLKVYCPFGDVWNGMVAINEKNTSYEIVIQCPQDNTEKLEDALKVTKIIDWTKNITIPFAPNHVIECIKRVSKDVGVDIELILPSESFIMHRETMMFEDIGLSPDTTIELMLPEHASTVDSKWPHRYPGSLWYNQLLINTKSGYGLFKNGVLVSWVFINEAGTLGQMFTLEEYRRNGYAIMLLKFICNVLLKEGKDVFAFCVKGNLSASKLYRKVGFQSYDCGVAWCYLKSK